METVLEIETRRQHHQVSLDAARNQAERNRWGQFATPLPLALEIADYAAALWQKRTDRVRFLDPAASVIPGHLSDYAPPGAIGAPGTPTTVPV